MRRPGVRFGVALAGAWLACVLSAACGGPRLPAPLPYKQQPTSALLQADYPPPPGRVEAVPKAPHADAVWLDGEWAWTGGRWSWKAGRWVVPPANATYSPWTGTRDTTGNYYVAEGTWRDAKGQDLPDPPALVTAKVRGGGVVGADGEDVPVTPNVRPERQRDGTERRGAKDAGPPETPSGATPTGTEPKTDAGAPVRGDGAGAGDGGASYEAPAGESWPRMAARL